MRLLWLADVLRGAGLTVHGVDGWRKRGGASYGPVRGITCHHTAGSRTSTDAGELRVLVHGRGSPGDANYLPGPISQLYLSRSGEWWTVASGTANHNKIGWGGPNRGFGNDSLLGIEAQHSGGSEPWTEVQYRSYVRGVAALVRHRATGYSVPLSHVAGHKEHQPGDKTDPTFNMDRFRADVATMLAGEDDDVSKADVIDALDDATPWLSDGVRALAKTAGWADQISTRALIELLFGEVILQGRGKHAALMAAVLNADEEVVRKLGGGELSPERIAEVLAPVLGANREAVGRILAGLPASG